MQSFKEQHDENALFSSQQEALLRDEAKRIIQKYPNRIPVIVEKKAGSTGPDLDKNKFLVPKDLTVSQFAYVIRKRIKLKPENAIFLLINNTSVMPATTEKMGDLYEKYKDESNFLSMILTYESVFG